MKTWLSVCVGFTLLVLATPTLAQNRALKPKAHKPVSPPVGVVPADMSPEAAEVVWLYHHNGTHDDVLHYVNSSHADFKLSVEDVNYLKDIGVSTEVVFAMIRSPEARENVLRLRDREPMWPVANHPQGKQEEPQNALANHNQIQTEDVNVNLEHEHVPHYYGPANGYPHPYPVPVPQGQFNGVPLPQGQPYYAPGQVPVPQGQYYGYPAPAPVPVPQGQ